MSKSKHYLSLVLVLISAISILYHTQPALAASSFSLIVLSSYQEVVDVGDSFYLFAITSTGKKAAWSSSNSKTASVNTYGKVTAKKPGTATIYAKIKDAEASCRVTVRKTGITLSRTSLSLENGEQATLAATTTNASAVKWKSSKPSIASVDENGTVTAKKPGETSITAQADGTTVTCSVKVKKPRVTLSRSSATLYRKGTVKLSVDSTSPSTPSWKTNRKSVATVSDTGLVTAHKHGTALITVKVDGVVKTCEITVKQPEVTLSADKVELKKGETFTLCAKVSSGNKPTWTVSNTAVATVNAKGIVTAHGTGRTYVYAVEDGIKARCTIRVTE